MATTFTAQINGQNVDESTSYCYLYEPLRINVSESDVSARQIFIDMTVSNTSDGVVVDAKPLYGLYDKNPNGALEIDLTRIIQQYHDSSVFKIGEISDLTTSLDIPVSKYKYLFRIYSDSDSIGQLTSLLPIVGGRDFYDFNPIVSQSQALTEAELYNVDLTGRWRDYPNIVTALSNPTIQASNPIVSVTTETLANRKPCGGMLIWKSRFGGWMYWGMDIATRTLNKKYKGRLNVGMFEANGSGTPYVETDYVSIDSSYNMNLKALSLSNDELESVAGIINSVAVYYMRDSTSKLELMRVVSSAAPISTLVGGGDFNVQLTSISSTSQKSR